jgi:hypothetical protein
MLVMHVMTVHVYPIMCLSSFPLVRVRQEFDLFRTDGSKGHVFEISIVELYIILTYAVLREFISIRW